jgi:hypothetical protein
MKWLLCAPASFPSGQLRAPTDFTYCYSSSTPSGVLLQLCADPSHIPTKPPFPSRASISCLLFATFPVPSRKYVVYLQRVSLSHSRCRRCPPTRRFRPPVITPSATQFGAFAETSTSLGILSQRDTAAPFFSVPAAKHHLSPLYLAELGILSETRPITKLSIDVRPYSAAAFHPRAHSSTKQLLALFLANWLRHLPASPIRPHYSRTEGNLTVRCHGSPSDAEQ